jgi:hypothetical protein
MAFGRDGKHVVELRAIYLCLGVYQIFNMKTQCHIYLYPSLGTYFQYVCSGKKGCSVPSQS